MVGGDSKKEKKKWRWYIQDWSLENSGLSESSIKPRWPLTIRDRSKEGHRRVGWQEKEVKNPAWERETAWHHLTLWPVAVKGEILGSKSEDAWAPHWAISKPWHLHMHWHLPPISHRENKTQDIHTILLARVQRQEHTISLSSSRRLEMPLMGNHGDELIGQLESHAYNTARAVGPRDWQPQ